MKLPFTVRVSIPSLLRAGRWLWRSVVGQDPTKTCPTCGGLGCVAYKPDTPVGVTDPAYIIPGKRGPWTCPLCWGAKIVAADVKPIPYVR